MANVTFKRGQSKDLSKVALKDGQISFTVDDGKIHIDYLNANNELVRKTLYSGVLTIGDKKYDGSQDVDITVYGGEVAD